jgi:DNA polymerase elongation subunit (family B)
VAATGRAAPKILILDIETFPITAEVWSAYEANALRILRDSIIVCFSVKWLGGKQITKALPDYPGYKTGAEDDRRLVAELRGLLDEADVVVAHNGRKFDFKRINARMVIHGILPPSPYATVDTLVAARQHFGFSQNKLDALGKTLGVGQKVHTGGYTLWQGCLAGDERAWRRMKRYNAQDVTLLERVYRRLLPWIKNHPNHGTYTGIASCPNCGSTKIQRRGSARATTRTYQRFQCQKCGKWCRSVESEDGRASLVSA